MFLKIFPRFGVMCNAIHIQINYMYTYVHYDILLYILCGTYYVCVCVYVCILDTQPVICTIF